MANHESDDKPYWLTSYSNGITVGELRVYAGNSWAEVAVCTESDYHPLNPIPAYEPPNRDDEDGVDPPTSPVHSPFGWIDQGFEGVFAGGSNPFPTLEDAQRAFYHALEAWSTYDILAMHDVDRPHVSGETHYQGVIEFFVAMGCDIELYISADTPELATDLEGLQDLIEFLIWAYEQEPEDAAFRRYQLLKALEEIIEQAFRLVEAFYNRIEDTGESQGEYPFVLPRELWEQWSTIQARYEPIFVGLSRSFDGSDESDNWLMKLRKEQEQLEQSGRFAHAWWYVSPFPS